MEFFWNLNSCLDASILVLWSKKSLEKLKLKTTDRALQLKVWDLSRIFSSHLDLAFPGSPPCHPPPPPRTPPSPHLTQAHPKICSTLKSSKKVKLRLIGATKDLIPTQKLQQRKEKTTHLWKTILKEGKVMRGSNKRRGKFVNSKDECFYDFSVFKDESKICVYW